MTFIGGQFRKRYLSHQWPKLVGKLLIRNFLWNLSTTNELIHWGRVTHICVSKLTIIGSDHGLSPGRCQAMIWTNAEILLMGPLGTKFSEIFIEMHTFSFKKMYLKMSSGKWQPSYLSLNVLRQTSDSLAHPSLILWWTGMISCSHLMSGVESLWESTICNF